MPRYTAIARLLHWITALVVLATIPAGLVMVREDIPRSTQDMLFIFHKNVGVVILLLVLLRVAWRGIHRAPPLPESVAALQRRIAVATHWLLYAGLTVMALSGYTRVVAGGFPIELLDALGAPSLVPRSDPLAESAKAVHFYVHYAVIALVVLHVLAALYHGLVRRDGVFSRIWPPIGG